MSGLLETTAEEFNAGFSNGVTGALVAAQQVTKSMRYRIPKCLDLAEQRQVQDDSLSCLALYLDMVHYDLAQHSIWAACKGHARACKLALQVSSVIHDRSASSCEAASVPAIKLHETWHPCMQVLPGMVKAGRGTIIFTGATAALRGGKGFALLSVPSFALRSLGQSIAREFGPQVQSRLLTFAVWTPNAAGTLPIAIASSSADAQMALMSVA